MRNLIFAILVLCGGISLNAQDLPEIVYLKNGNFIRGRVVQLIPNEKLEIKSGDGKIYTYRMSEIVRIERNLSAPQTTESDTSTDVDTNIDADIDNSSDYIEPIPAPTPRKQSASDKQRRMRTERSYDDDDVYNRRYYSSNRNYESYKQSDKAGVFNFGIKGGMNLATFVGKGVEGIDEKIGFNAGIFVEYTLPVNVYFLSGLEFSVKGAKGEESDYREKTKITFNPMYLQLPIHIGYKGYLSDDISLGLHAGPYFAYGIGGKTKVAVTDYYGDTKEGEVDFFGKANEVGAKAFDFGLGFGLDLDINMFRIGIGYDFGLNNIYRDSDYPVRNQNFYIQVGCKF